MRAELERHCSDLSASQTANRNLELLQQMEIIRLEALVALDRLQHSQAMNTGYSGLDYESELEQLP